MKTQALFLQAICKRLWGRKSGSMLIARELLLDTLAAIAKQLWNLNKNRTAHKDIKIVICYATL